MKNVSKTHQLNDSKTAKKESKADSSSEIQRKEKIYFYRDILFNNDHNNRADVNSIQRFIIRRRKNNTMSKKVVESIQKNLFKIIYMVILITLLTILINKEKIIQNDDSTFTGMEQFVEENK